MQKICYTCFGSIQHNMTLHQAKHQAKQECDKITASSFELLLVFIWKVFIIFYLIECYKGIHLLLNGPLSKNNLQLIVFTFNKKYEVLARPMWDPLNERKSASLPFLSTAAWRTFCWWTHVRVQGLQCMTWEEGRPKSFKILEA